MKVTFKVQMLEYSLNKITITLKKKNQSDKTKSD